MKTEKHYTTTENTTLLQKTVPYDYTDSTESSVK